MTGEHSVQEFQLSSAQYQTVLQRLSAFQNRKILVVGDIGLDEYLLGDVRRTSPEAPVPILEVTSEDERLGLAANVALNIETLTGKSMLVSVVGDDAGGEKLRALCQRNKVSAEHFIVDSHRPTTRKTRVMAGPHHIVRVDHELRRYISTDTEKKIMNRVRDLIDQAEGVILQDYAKGVVTAELVQQLVKLCREKKKEMFVDPTRVNLASFYRGADVIKPNYEEALALSGLKFEELKDNPNKIFEVAEQIKLRSESRKVVITRGAQGMLIFSGDEITRVPTYAKKVFDVTGAGDTVIAALTLSQVSGFSLVDSAVISNHAAGIVVGKVGCVPCEMKDLQSSLAEAKSDLENSKS